MSLTKEQVEESKIKYINLIWKYTKELRENQRNPLFYENTKLLYMKVNEDLVKGLNDINFYEKEIKNNLLKIKDLRQSSIKKYWLFKLFFWHAKEVNKMGSDIKIKNYGFQSMLNKFFMYASGLGGNWISNGSLQSDHAIYNNIESIVSLTKELDKFVSLKKKINFWRTKDLEIYDLLTIPELESFKSKVLSLSERIKEKENQNHQERVKWNVSMEWLLFKSLFLSFMKSPIQSEDIHHSYEKLLIQISNYSKKLYELVTGIKDYESKVEKEKQNIEKFEKEKKVSKQNKEENLPEDIEDDWTVENENYFSNNLENLELEEFDELEMNEEDELEEIPEEYWNSLKGKLLNLEEEHKELVRNRIFDLLDIDFKLKERTQTIYKNRIINYNLNKKINKLGETLKILLDTEFDLKLFLNKSEELIDYFKEINLTKEEIIWFFRKLNSIKLQKFIKFNGAKIKRLSLKELIELLKE